MNIIKQLRLQAGITQQNLADRAGTSQPTIALYESGRKSPTLNTLINLADSMNLEIVAKFTPKLTREDHRSLAYHQAVVDKLKKNPNKIIKVAKTNLNKMLKTHPHAKELLLIWKEWLKLPLSILIKNILDYDPQARELRHVSPFAGLLSPKERVKILSEFRKEYKQ